jgi:hypothetical protein
MTKQERRTALARLLSCKIQQPVGDDDKYTGPILDFLLATLEPVSSDRPSASELLSHSIFQIKDDQGEQNGDMLVADGIAALTV